MSEAAYSDYMSAVAEVAPTEDFTMNMHVNLGEGYRLTINEYDALMIMGTTGTPVVTREFYEESLHILLDDGTITQDQYDQLMAVDPEYFML